MNWFIQDYDDTQIFLSNGWQEFFITKFNINKAFPIEGDSVLISWTDLEKGTKESRSQWINYLDVVDGYGGYLSNPTSAADLRATLLQYYDSGFGGGGGNILTAKADLLSHDGASDTILPGGTNEYILSRDNTEATGLKWIPKSAITTGFVVGPASATDSAIALFDTATGKLIKDSGVAISTDGTFAANSDTKAPTEKAVKTYVDSKTGYTMFHQFLTVNPTNNTTRYFGNHPRTIQGSADQSKMYFPKAGTIKSAEVWTFANGTVGSNENISMYVRINNTTDHLIQTVGAATAERRFTNAALAVAVTTADYYEIKIVFPTFATGITQLTGGGNLYIAT